MPGSHFLESVNERYGDFRVAKVTPLHELNCVLREIVHEPTGALVMHIENDDTENLFCLSFKTYPENSRGAAHILEHTVLCGSKKFPVKDPFFAMTRRSLNTFMNALTGADFTCYPAATQVKKDFYNLLDVYLDAVFHPQLKELSFLQEGHHLAFADRSDPNSPLQFKGIVFNEMKGSMTSNDTRLIQRVMQALLPDLTYAHNSGGDPKEIPHLTYEELINFHETYYHPSRCLFFFYGNFPLKEHLDFLAEKALKNVLKQPPIPPMARQKRFEKPLLLEDRYPIDPSENPHKKTMISFSWLTAPLEDQKTLLALSVLDCALMETDASPLRHALLKSGLCVQASSYLDTEMSEIPYLIVCKGCEKEDADALQAVLFSTLQDIAEKGVPYHLVEAAIHQLEFSRTEITGDHSPFGLTLFMRSALAKQHNCPPENALLIQTLFDELLESVKDPTYLTSLIRKYFIKNSHFVRVVMRPDKELARKEHQEEIDTLKKIQESLTEEEKEKIIIQSELLNRYQKETENQSLECLPKVSLSDVPEATRDFVLQEETVGNLRVFHHDCFTNHIVYADLIFDHADIAEEELPYVQLMLSLFPEVGVGKRDYKANLEYIQEHTGGVSATSALYVQAADHHLMKPCITVRGKALARKADKLFSLLKEMALSVRFDETKRIEELIRQLSSSLQNRLSRNALRYAIHLSLSGFSNASFISESMNGLKYFQAIQEMVKNLESNLPAILEKLTSLKNRLFCVKHPHLVLSCDKETYHELREHRFYGLSDLPGKEFKPWAPHYALAPTPSQARPISSPVAFTCEAFQTIAYLHPHAAALSIATHIMDNKILHPKVRERGGAYGVGAHFGPMLGNFYFHSYRDPHILRTLDTFHEAIDTLAAGGFDDRDLLEAKLGMIQQMDTPVAPGSRALYAYNWWREGKTKQMRQNYRDKLIASTAQDIQQAVQTDLLPKKESGVVVTLADHALLEKENQLLASLNRPQLPIIPIHVGKTEEEEDEEDLP